MLTRKGKSVWLEQRAPDGVWLACTMSRSARTIDKAVKLTIADADAKQIIRRDNPRGYRVLCGCDVVYCTI